MLRVSLAATLAGSALAACPYSALWIEHGPERAREILNKRAAADKESPFKAASAALRHSSRRLQAEPEGFGTCTSTPPFGPPDPQCVLFMGKDWDSTSAKAVCDRSMGGPGAYTEDSTCGMPDAAGMCVSGTADQAQATMMKLGGMSPDCGSLAQACGQWMGGTFVGIGECADTGAGGGPMDSPTSGPMGPSFNTGQVERCSIAPGPIGAGHMLGFSPGYSDCPEELDIPARDSPFMWPEKWSAIQDSYVMPSVDAEDQNYAYHSRGRQYYDFKNNMRRGDMEWVSGVRTGSASDFGANNPDPKYNTKNTTFVHRGSEMVMISWGEKEGDYTCTKQDMSVIGMIRPDWFLDARGAQSSNQFLGNQHVYHPTLGPTLVKQWRKTDFADMYFVMSMQALPGKDGIHWPMMRNDPGEGFGNDALHAYSEHRILGDDEDVFFPDRDLECITNMMGGAPPGAAGGDEGQASMEEMMMIPSGLNVVEAGWIEYEWTGSPQGPANPEPPQMSGAAASMSVDLDGMGTLDYCLNDDGSLKLEAAFLTAQMSSTAVWVSLGFRPDHVGDNDHCRMQPSTILLAEPQDDTADFVVRFGEMKSTLQNWAVTDDAIQEQRDSMMVVESDGSDAGISELVMQYEDGMTHMHATYGGQFDSSSSVPMIWGMGGSGKLAYHTNRGCITLKNIQKCGGGMMMTSPVAPSEDSNTAQCASEDALEDTKSELAAGIESLAAQIAELQKSLGGDNDAPKCDSLKMVRCKKMAGCEWKKQKKTCMRT